MASAINRLVSLVVIFAITLAVSESVLRIAIEPQEWDGVPDVLNVTCTADIPADWENSILMIDIVNEASQRSVVSINNKQKMHKGSLKDNMKAHGFIDTNLASATQSYLTLTIAKPVPQDSGAYKCRMYYFDETNTIDTEVAISKIRHGNCPDGWTFYKADETCLKAFGLDDMFKHLSWSRARQACHKFGGDLVQIRDEKKNTFVYKMVYSSSDSAPWIGIKNAAKNGFDFKFVDGSSVPDTYQPWRRNNPNGEKDLSDKCVYIFPFPSERGKWGDFDCDSSESYVCSIPIDASAVF